MEDFVRNRITQLRISKGVSEYKMSYDLGHSRSYVNNITSGKALPSLAEFFAICEYFNITPVEFFDAEISNPYTANKAFDIIKGLNESDIELISLFAKRLKGLK